MKKRLLSFFLSIGLLSYPYVLSAQGAPSRGCPSPGTIEQKSIEILNATRSQPRNCGNRHFQSTEPLRWSPALAEAANRHVKDMSQRGYFDHKGSDGRWPGDRITAAGYTWRTYGENLALGHSTMAEIIENWLESSEHCSNLMNGAFTETGIACAAGGDQTPYWVMVLAAPLWGERR